MDRIKFIKTCGFVCIGGTALASLLESCASTNYFAQTTITSNQITIKKTEFVKTENGKAMQREYVLVEVTEYRFPICIFKISEENYSALFMQCTHRGCELKPTGNYLTCPCHGSEFTNQGVVQHPPAEDNLITFKTTTDNENIYIQL